MEESGSQQDPSDRVDFLFVYFNIASCYLILGSMAISSDSSLEFRNQVIEVSGGIFVNNKHLEK